MAPLRPTDNGTRVQALTLLQKKTPILEIMADTGYSKGAIYEILKKAKQRGYDPEKDKKVLIAYVEDAPRSGRPKKCTPEVEEEVIKIISKNSTTRQLSTDMIASMLTPLVKGGISARSVHRILRRRGYKPCKQTSKPGLTAENKLTRLKWCLEHKDWKLEDWKKVIWSDETSVTWGGQRGRIRVWRRSDEAYLYHCIRRRWKGFKQFMWWSCFSYDEKGPWHIWEDETKKEKEEAEKWLAEENSRIEEECKLAWEIETAMQRLRITRNIRGRKPTWKWNEKNGKLIRKASRGGIDWYRYYKEILQKRLLPFAKRCKLSRPDTIVQEDNAIPHAHKYQAKVHNIWEIIRLLQPSNSPDLNAIEPCWFWMKKRATRKGVASGVKQMKKDWEQAWKDLPQRKIQEWIERIEGHIKEIIRLDGGNEYKEGRKNRDRVY